MKCQRSKKIIDKIEPEWCYEDKKYEIIDYDEPGILDRFDEEDDYDLYMADVMHEEMMLGK